MVGMRPLLTSSRLDDRREKVMWLDDHWAVVEGGQGYADVVNGNLYLAMSLRNAGQGLGVLQGWRIYPERLLSSAPHADPVEFQRQTRDLYIAAHDVGYWHAAYRDADDPDYEALAKTLANRDAFTIDLLYSDHEGGQRIISRF